MNHLALAAAIVLAANPAHAEPATTISVEPMFLIIPFAEITAERMVTPNVGIAATGGIGHVFVPIGNMLYDLGAQGNVYLVRHFAGPHLGAELKYWWGSSGGDLVPGGPSVMSSSATERELGVYAGYKWMARYGLSATIQLGVGRFDVSSTSDPPSSRIVPLANLTIGWSF
jgi:hypothetical protein